MLFHSRVMSYQPFHIVLGWRLVGCIGLIHASSRLNYFWKRFGWNFELYCGVISMG